MTDGAENSGPIEPASSKAEERPPCPEGNAPPPDFFCFGPPKSGTTMLQRMLDLHPKVSCPSEHHLRAYKDLLLQIAQAYNKHRETRDSWIGGYGAPPIAEATSMGIWRDAVARILRDAGAGKPICGANDNELMEQPELIRDHFPKAKLIAIFRHPLDQAISAWHANERLSKQEGDPRHRDLQTKFGGLDGWVEHNAKRFVVLARRLATICKDQPILTLRYEAVTQDRTRALKRVFSFLEVEASPALRARIAEATTFERMRKEAPDPSFMNRGAEGYSASPDLRARVEIIAGPVMRRLGYDVESDA
ncbi:MAG: sulfotransferase [Kiloniellales bacterium]